MRHVSSNLIKHTLISGLLLSGLSLTGCSTNTESTTASDYITNTISTTTEAVSEAKESETPVVNPNVSIPKELADTDQVFWQAVPELYTSAYNYSESISAANLLLCQYYRSTRDKFTTEQWNILSGYIDTDFISYINDNASGNMDIDTLNALSDQGVFYEPVSGERIELSHFFASLNLLVKKRQSALRNGNTGNNHPVYDLATWAGDCYELAQDVFMADSSSMDDDELSEYISSMLGENAGHFNRDNMLADIDSYNIACMLKNEDDVLMEKISEYYSNLLSGASRFEIFRNNRYSSNAGADDIAKATYNVLVSADNIYLPLLRQSLNIDIDNAEQLRILSAISSQFAEYILNQS